LAMCVGVLVPWMMIKFSYDTSTLRRKAVLHTCLYFIYNKNLVTFKRKSRGELTDLLSS